MMRVIILLFLFSFALMADSKETCFTVQLLSKKDLTSKDNFRSSEYPEECKPMIVGRAFTIRCGCYDDKTLAEQQHKEILLDYPDSRVMSTYKYRFDEIIAPPKQESQSIVTQEIKNEPRKEATPKRKKIRKTLTQEDEELKLILQVFLYKGDLKNAYKVANMGYTRNPKSYYWNQKMAEISKWTNRSARSMKHLRFMYEAKYDKKIEEELIAYGTESYQYEQIEPLVVSKAHHDPTEENVDLMILVYKKIGNPEKVVGVLEEEYKRDKTNTMLLTKALALSLEIEDMELASKYVAIIESQKPYTQKDAALISNYYYIEHDIDSAYKSLAYVDNLNITNKEDNVKYYELKSDLGWYLQDNINAAKASQELIRLESARLVDFERVAYVNKDKNRKLASDAQRKAYLKFKLPYLFYSYANNALERKEYKELHELIEEIDQENTSPLLKEALYWIIKSKVYRHLKQKDLERDALLYAINANPDNNEIKLVLLSYYVETDEHGKLQILLTEMAETQDLDISYYFPMASAYFYLGDVNRASYYTQKLINSGNKVTGFIEFKFMQAYIYQSKNNQNAFKKIMQEIELMMKNEAKANPELKKQDKFLSNYLRAAIHVLDADKFKSKLKDAKKYLTKENYDDIAYSFALMHSAVEKSSKIYNRIEKKELWLIFSNSLLYNNHSEIENLLRSDLKSLAMGDASQAAYKDGQKALSQSIAYEGLMANDDNQNAYIQHLDTSKERSDKLRVKVAYNNRDPLLRKYVEAYNIMYLHNGYYFLSGVNHYYNYTLDEKQIFNIPETSTEAMLGIKGVFDKGYYKAEVSYFNSMTNYYGGLVLLNYRMSTDLTTTLYLGKSRPAIESVQLVLGGKKDVASVALVWAFLNSTSLNFAYEKYRYNSQDDVYLGEGDYKLLGLNYQIRNGYPDMKIGLFYDTGEYTESSLSKGVIDNIQKPYGVLPVDFYSIGGIFSYGMTNSENYTRVWRPYFEISSAYSNVTEDYTYNVHLGIGGKVFHQDHLAIGASYAESISGIGTQSYEIYLNYRFFYSHP